MCVIAVDYDGTITSDFEEARIALTELKQRGHTIVIWSSRNNPIQHGLQQCVVFQEMIEMLSLYKIPYDYIDTGNQGKLHAQVYIDDKAWRFERNWDQILQRIY